MDASVKLQEGIMAFLTQDPDTTFQCDYALHEEQFGIPKQKVLDMTAGVLLLHPFPTPPLTVFHPSLHILDWRLLEKCSSNGRVGRYFFHFKSFLERPLC